MKDLVSISNLHSGDFDVYPFVVPAGRRSDERTKCRDGPAVLADEASCHERIASDIDPTSAGIELLPVELQCVGIFSQYLKYVLG